jgi:hypothetical protein
VQGAGKVKKNRPSKVVCGLEKKKIAKAEGAERAEESDA